MELDLHFSDEDLVDDRHVKRTINDIDDYAPKIENARWFIDDQQPLDQRSESELYHTANKLAVDGQPEPALAAYKQLLARCGKNVSSRRELLDSCVRCLLLLGRPAEAVPLLARGRPLLVSRDHVLIWRELAADVHERLAAPERSLSLRQAVVAADEQSPPAWLALAAVYRQLADAGVRPERSRRLHGWALVWARVTLAEAGRAGGGFVADATRRLLADVDATLVDVPFATAELFAKLRHTMACAGPVHDHGFVDRGSSKFHEETNATELDELSCEQFERKWFDRFM